MENSFQTSFIPKKPLVGNGSSSGSKSSTSLFMVGSVIILVIVGAIAGGLYFYRDYLKKDKDQLSTSLLKIKNSFNEGTIVELAAYDKKSSVAKQVLGDHLILSPLFEAINDYTLTSIQFTKFNEEIKNNILTVTMSGTARDYKSIALQANVFNTNKPDMFKNLIFSNLTKDKNNFVTFDVEFNVDSKLLLYSNNIKNIGPGVANNTANPNTASINFNNNQPLEATNGIQ